MTYFYFKQNGSEAERLIEIRKAVGDSIARMRQQADMTQEAVAEKLGIGPEAVSRMERGVGSVTVERLIVLAEMFGCRADELLLQATHRPMDQGAERSYLMETLRNFCRYVLEREQVMRERA